MLFCSTRLFFLILVVIAFGHSVTSVRGDRDPVQYELRADDYWRVTMPNGMRFDTSGLALDAGGRLLTVHDRNPEVWHIQPSKRDGSLESHVAGVSMLTNCFTPLQLRPFAHEKIDRYDTEGLSVDSQGRLYTCEEANRWILRFDPSRGVVERLPIDWSTVRRYFSSDANASFEGVAVGDDQRLYVANERNSARIFVVDLRTFEIIDHFAVSPRGSGFDFLHYSDLCWHRGFLYVLCRHQYVILKVDPSTHRVLAEYRYKKLENSPEHRYQSRYPTGIMEGLAVDDQNFWLLTDNNCETRKQDPKDRRPTLFRCLRPDTLGTTR